MYYGELVRLRALEMSDLANIMKGWNNFEMRRFLANTIPYSENAEKEWLERATKFDPWKDGNLILVIEDKKTKAFLGTTGLHSISKQNGRAEFGMAIHDPKNFGKGYGTDAGRVMLWVGFHVLGLNSIYLYTLAHNVRAQRAYQKAGFKKAGVYRQMMFVEGKFNDTIAMDIMRDEFLELYPPGSRVGEPPTA